MAMWKEFKVNLMHIQTFVKLLSKIGKGIKRFKATDEQQWNKYFCLNKFAHVEY